MGIEFCTFSHQVISTSEQIPGCSHLGRVGIGHGDHASPEEHGDFVGIDFIIFGFSSVDGFHIQGMAKDKGDILSGAQIRDPVPGEHAFHGDHNIFPEGVYEVEKDISSSGNVSV